MPLLYKATVKLPMCSRLTMWAIESLCGSVASVYVLLLCVCVSPFLFYMWWSMKCTLSELFDCTLKCKYDQLIDMVCLTLKDLLVINVKGVYMWWSMKWTLTELYDCRLKVNMISCRHCMSDTERVTCHKCQRCIYLRETVIRTQVYFNCNCIIH